MKGIFRILLISLLSFTIISCSKKDESESSGSSGSNIQLSNIKANLAGKSLFISTGNKSTYSTTNKSSSTNRSQYKSDSQLENTSLFTLSTDSQLDYGILSDYKLEIDELIPYSNNEYAIATLSYGTYLDYDSEYNQNIRDLNCGILNIEISKSTISCGEVSVATAQQGRYPMVAGQTATLEGRLKTITEKTPWQLHVED